MMVNENTQNDATELVVTETCIDLCTADTPCIEHKCGSPAQHIFDWFCLCPVNVSNIRHIFLNTLNDNGVNINDNAPAQQFLSDMVIQYTKNTEQHLNLSK